jgi:ABC-type Zn uptake system ZnuABC Zn-binding protein ZnuA
MDHDDHDLPEIHAELVAHTLSFPEEMVCYDMSTHTLNMSLTTESDCQTAGLMWTANTSDDDHSDEEEHHEMGAIVIHIEAEGDYGFALPNDIRMHIVMGERGHDGHDDHDDHEDDHDDDRDDHDDHDDDHDDDRDDHDDHDDDHDDALEGDGDAFTYDPHSWLSPLAFEAQLNIVLDTLNSIFPDGSSDFSVNAALYSSQLVDLHERFTVAFGEDGTCDMAGQDKTIVANHNAYSYISSEYDIDIITLHGLDPEGEPSPGDIAEVVESIEEKEITVLFVEEYTDQTAVNSIVEQTGVSLLILYTMEMAPSDPSDNYLSMMDKNLENLISGCGC